MSDAHHDEIAKLEALFDEHPEGRIFTPLAEAYRKAGRLDRAHEVLARGIERHPEYSSAHVVLGRVLMDQDRTEEADAEFRRVLELDPHNLIATRALGDLARSRGDEEQALEYYRRLLEQEPNEEVRGIVDELTSGVAVPAGAPGEPGAALARESAEEAEETGGVEETGEVGEAEEVEETGEVGEPSGAVASPELEAGELEAGELAAGELAAGEGPDEALHEPGLPDVEWETEQAEDAGEPELEAWTPPEAELPEAAEETEGTEEEEAEAPWSTSSPEGEPVEEGWVGGGGSELTGGWPGTAPEGETASEPTEEPASWYGGMGPGTVDEELGRPVGQPPEDAEVRTETIAQVYARQGLYDRAAEVYRELVRRRPEDEELKDRLAEMEQLAAAQEGRAEVEAVSDFPPEPAGSPEGIEAFEGLEGLQELEGVEELEELEEIEGFESAEFESAELESPELESPELESFEEESEPLEGLEPMELDPETGLAASAASESVPWEANKLREELAEELDVRDVPEPPEEMPWGAPSEAEVELEADSGAEPEAETPHAWADEEEQAAPPIRDYMGSLLAWSGAEGAEPEAGRGGPAEEPVVETPASEAGEAEGSAGEAEVATGEAARPAAPGAAEEGEDEDLEMLRSWLESLKQ